MWLYTKSQYKVSAGNGIMNDFFFYLFSSMYFVNFNSEYYIIFVKE